MDPSRTWLDLFRARLLTDCPALQQQGHGRIVLISQLRLYLYNPLQLREHAEEKYLRRLGSGDGSPTRQDVYALNQSCDISARGRQDLRDFSCSCFVGHFPELAESPHTQPAGDFEPKLLRRMVVRTYVNEDSILSINAEASLEIIGAGYHPLTTIGAGCLTTYVCSFFNQSSLSFHFFPGIAID